MAYTIYKASIIIGQPPVLGEFLGSGFNRAQVTRELARLGLLTRPTDGCPRLPRFGAAIIIIQPGLDYPYIIRHV